MRTIRELRSKLNNHKFACLEMYEIGTALTMMCANVYFDSKMSVRNKIWYIIKWLLYDTYDYKCIGSDNDIILVYSDERIKRDDYKKIYENVCDVLNTGKIIPYNRVKKKWHFLSEIGLRLKLMLSWMDSIKNCAVDFRNTIRMITDVMRIYNMHTFLNSMQFPNIKGVIVFCDIFPTDNICVQYFKSRGIVTMTLQHAAFTAALENPTNINDCGIELTYSISDYFLGWNQYTKEQAISCGMRKEKFCIVGIPQFINFNYSNINRRKKGCFGVILGVKEYDNVNQDLVKIACQIAEKYQVNYYLKYHPNFQGNEYNSLTNKYCKGNFTSRDLRQYVDSVDFSILGVTSMIVELVYLGHDIYRYRIDSDKDKYSQMNIPNFKNIEGFVSVYNCSSQELFDYLCYTRNVGKSYRHTLQKIIMEGECSDD